MEVTIADVRTGTDTEWTTRVLPMPYGETGINLTTGEVKLGSGLTWNNTPVFANVNNLPLVSASLLAAVASSGDYADLDDPPTIPDSAEDVGAETPSGAQSKANAAASAAVASHVGASDPHEQYLKEPNPLLPAIPAPTGAVAAVSGILIGGQCANPATVTVVTNLVARVNALEARLKAVPLIL